MFCCTLLYVHSSFAIILMGKRELVAFLGLSYRCIVIAVLRFLAMPWVCLRFVIMIFPDHTHLLFLLVLSICNQKNEIQICSNKHETSLAYNGGLNLLIKGDTFHYMARLGVFHY